MVYRGTPPTALDPHTGTRGYPALARMESQLATTRFLVGDLFTLADVALLAYTRVAHEGGFDLTGYSAVQCWISDSETALALSAQT